MEYVIVELKMEYKKLFMKERLQEQAQNKYRELSNEDKDVKRGYG